MAVTLNARIRHHRLTTTTQIPTAAPSADPTDGTWVATDIADGELGINTTDEKIWFNAGSEIIQLMNHGVNNSEDTVTDSMILGNNWTLDTVDNCVFIGDGTGLTPTSISDKIIIGSPYTYGQSTTSSVSTLYNQTIKAFSPSNSIEYLHLDNADNELLYLYSEYDSTFWKNRLAFSDSGNLRLELFNNSSGNAEINAANDMLISSGGDLNLIVNNDTDQFIVSNDDSGHIYIQAEDVSTDPLLTLVGDLTITNDGTDTTISTVTNNLSIEVDDSDLISIGTVTSGVNMSFQDTHTVVHKNILSASPPGLISIGIDGAHFGTCRAFLWQSTSDINLKKDIVKLDLGLDFIKDINTYSYKYKDSVKDETYFGFIAQDILEKINKYTDVTDTSHSIVSKDVNYYMSYNDMIPILVNAVKEQDLMIQEMKQMMLQMRAELDLLKS